MRCVAVLAPVPNDAALPYRDLPRVPALKLAARFRFFSYPGTASAMPGSFYIFSRGGGADWLSICDIGLEFGQEFGVLRHLLARRSDQVQTRRPVGFAAQLG